MKLIWSLFFLFVGFCEIHSEVLTSFPEKVLEYSHPECDIIVLKEDSKIWVQISSENSEFKYDFNLTNVAGEDVDLVGFTPLSQLQKNGAGTKLTWVPQGFLLNGLAEGSYYCCVYDRTEKDLIIKFWFAITLNERGKGKGKAEVVSP